MEQAYSIFMFIFAGALLLYAVAVALTRSTDLIPRMDRVSVKDEKRYAWQFAKTMAIVALAPAVSALVGLLLGPMAGLIALLPAMVVCIALGVRYAGKELDDTPEKDEDE